MTPLECIPENMFIEWVNDRTKFYDVCIRNMEFISSKIVFRDCLVDDVVGEILMGMKEVMKVSMRMMGIRMKWLMK